MNREQIKYIAISAMLLDHIGMLFLPLHTPLGYLCRFVGRLTAPLMCFFLTEGFARTSSKKRYGLRLLIFAVISQPVYAWACGVPLWEPEMNMLFTLFLCFLILLTEERLPQGPRICAQVGLVVLSAWCDWSLWAPLWVLGFWRYRDSRKKQVAWYCAVAGLRVIEGLLDLQNGTPLYAVSVFLGLFLAVPFLLLYDGRRGRGGKWAKWAFYWFYPLHLLVLMLLKQVL